MFCCLLDCRSLFYHPKSSATTIVAIEARIPVPTDD
jgi:hypothetical protein